MAIVEIRTYRLRRGTAPAFERAMRDEALPMLAAAGIEVVRFSMSLVPDEHPEPDAVLVRAFADLDTRARQEDAFYGGEAWRHGPRERVLTCIEAFHTIVLASPQEGCE